MRVSIASPLLLLMMVLWGPNAEARDPVSALDKASACQRRGQLDCALRNATRALEALPIGERPALRREALRLRARALALMGEGEQAKSAFVAVLTDDPNYRPATDEPEAIQSAWRAAREGTIAERLPTSLDPGYPPLPPPPKPRPQLEPYDPAADMASQPEDIIRLPWSIALGGGVAIPMPDSDARYVPGPTAALEVTRHIIGPLRAWAHATLSVLSISESVIVEPGYRGQLAIASGVVGLQVEIAVIDWIDVVFSAGLGGAGFGAQSPRENFGLGVAGSAGLRMRVDRHLAIRADALPLLVVPMEGTTGGHLDVLVRAELSF